MVRITPTHIAVESKCCSHSVSVVREQSKISHTPEDLVHTHREMHSFTHGFPMLLFLNLFNEFCMINHENMVFGKLLVGSCNRNTPMFPSLRGAGQDKQELVMIVRD